MVFVFAFLDPWTIGTAEEEEEEEEEERGEARKGLRVHGSNLVCFCFVVVLFFSPHLFSGFSLISISQRALIAAPGGYLTP